MNRFYKLDATDVPASKKEVIRYLGYRALHQPDEKISSLIDSCILEMQKVLRPNLVYDEFHLKVEGNLCRAGEAEIVSEKLAKNLAGANRVIMFGATIGSEVDKLIRTTTVTDPAKAVIFQACGAMFVEEFVNDFNRRIESEMAAEGKSCCKRFSPGYGDLSLESQKLFFRILNCSKIGLTLMDTLIMAPEKSVTAFIGIKEGEE